MSSEEKGVRVFVHVLAGEAEEAAVERVYHSISRQLDGTPGLKGNELLRSLTEPRSFVVMSHWESLAAFRAWECDGSHRSTTASLRQYRQEDRAYGVYEVRASY